MALPRPPARLTAPSRSDTVIAEGVDARGDHPLAHAAMAAVAAAAARDRAVWPDAAAVPDKRVAPPGSALLGAVEPGGTCGRRRTVSAHRHPAWRTMATDPTPGPTLLATFANHPPTPSHTHPAGRTC